MTGIFQLLDRQHVLTGRRTSGQSPKRLPSGCSHFNNGTFEEENTCHCSTATLSFDQSSSSSQFGRQSLDLPNEVKDSMCRKDWRLPVRTSTKEETAESAVLKHENSPRPLQLSKSVNGSFSVEFQEASSSTSCRSKDGSLFSFQKDTHRLSYDGSDLSRLSFESQDSFKSTPKLKEHPRLSLDSRVGSVSSPKYDSKSEFVIKKSLRDGETRPPNVVAKLMGLETLPDSALASDSHLEFLKTCQVEHCDPFPSTVELLGGSSKKLDVKHLKKLGRATPSFPSKHFEFEKRLKDLELSQSGKDLRALKQLIDAMSPHLSAGSVNKQKQHSDCVNSFTHKGGNSLRTFQSKIAIMKPAKLVEKSDILASSVTPMDCLSSLPKLQGEYGDSRKSTLNYRSSKKKDSEKMEMLSVPAIITKTKFTSTSSPQLPKENTIGLVNSSGSVSPRLQQKKRELDNRCRPPIAPDSSKSRGQPNNQLPELGSLGGKRRPKSANLLRIDYQSSDISTETRNLSYQQDDCYMRSEGNVVMDSVIDTDVPNLDRCAESNGSQSPSMKNAKYSASRLVKKKLGPALSEDECLAEFASVASVHPCPVSVLEYPMYKDDALSPVKQMPDVLKGDGTMNSNSNSCRKQQGSAENLLTYHTGFLLRDLNSTFTNFQLHPLSLPINPQLFLVLEQIKSSTLHGQECSIKKPEKDKFHRKLIFDAVNEILVGKLASVGHSHEPWLRPEKQARKYLNAQKLLRDLCSEMEQLQAKKSGCGFEENEEDSLKSILCEDLVHPAENWTNFCGEISGTVLDVERLIFKALVDEIVHGEAVGLRIKLGRCCRQLSA
ncbi:hypothetical protein RHMOL_Rhmol08G0190900 [Rhododendron molle]|uniref:Uncharacterized protein n=1 Tax=Rhododendron molle TaxID=49168 RepID=A0ACC0MPX3_RHOML|nr:hypothetical protein RHMOL_Rhmol08G0190900 [Rhododendron molle]